MEVAVNPAAGLGRHVMSTTMACELEELNFERDELELELYSLQPGNDAKAVAMNARLLELNEIERAILKVGAK
jgi:hypothetical protein